MPYASAYNLIDLPDGICLVPLLPRTRLFPSPPLELPIEHVFLEDDPGVDGVHKGDADDEAGACQVVPEVKALGQLPPAGAQEEG